MEDKIILISGKQGSGKTTISKALRECLLSKNSNISIYKFAEPLYWMHDKCLSIVKSLYPKYDKEKDGKLLQLLGTEWGRESIDENIWINCLKERIVLARKHSQRMKWKKPIIIIDDCRFENEFLAFPEALKVRLTCNKDTRKLRADSWRDSDNHPSEIGLDKFEIENKFDLVLPTDKLLIGQCVESILSYTRKEKS